jgi:glycosyltransferase involved in cell wall biosynthesis
VLLEVFSRLIHQGYDLGLDIVGDIAHRDVYKEMKWYLQRQELKDRINWHGLKTGTEKHRIISEADILVLPTMNDTFPLTILEAMQHGLPVIASRKGAIPEIIEDGISGILIDPGNAQELGDKLIFLHDHPSVRVEMGNQAFENYRMKYTDQHFYSGIDRIFSSLL